MVPKQEAKVKEAKDTASTGKESGQRGGKVLTYQEWMDSLLDKPALKVIYEEEVAKKKK